MFYRQPIALVSLAYCMLWLTILSPQNIVFTSFLKSIGSKEWQLALFRGAGAVFGVASTFGFPSFVARFGMQSLLCAN